ncbi:MAG: NAD-dependent epimerase/dehydratase family protein [Rhodospirillaceae bacterium]
MAHYTVFGAGGFIGRHATAALRRDGHTVSTPMRTASFDAGADLGRVLYCAGLTADFRARPCDTMEAHVALPARILGAGRFESFLYLSSTRLYASASTGRESAIVTVDPSEPGDLYNLSKLSGEALCLAHPNPRVRVVRLANVYGAAMFDPGADPGNFLTSIVGDAVATGTVALLGSPDSAKDYLHVDDAVRAIVLIATRGRARLYNVASGRNVTHRRILDRLRDITGIAWSSSADGALVRFPRIATDRIAGEFSAAGECWNPVRLLDRIPELVNAASCGRKSIEGAVA